MTTQRPTLPALSIHISSDNLQSAPTKRSIYKLNSTGQHCMVRNLGSEELPLGSSQQSNTLPEPLMIS
jgi:hypothetical protein